MICKFIYYGVMCGNCSETDTYDEVTKADAIQAARKDGWQIGKKGGVLCCKCRRLR